MDVALSITEDPYTSSVRKLHQQHGPSVGSMHNILKKKFHPYKVRLLQELIEDDPDRRLEFCETMMIRIEANRKFLFRIVFSDEAMFELNGPVNRQNCRLWSDNNHDG